MTTTADRVRSLISDSGLSHHAFADEIGLDDSKLSKSLTGTRRFSSLDLARIGESQGVTVDWLISGYESALALAARTTGGSASMATAEGDRLAQFRRDVTYLGYPQLWQAPTVPLREGRAVDQGRAFAGAALAQVHAAGRSLSEPDLPTLIEEVFGADVAIADLGRGFDGLASSSDEVKLILAATSLVPTRQRFTLAHELAHLLTGDDQELHQDPDIYDPSLRKDPTELRANAFAAAFLMPEDVLRAAVGDRGLDETSFATLACDLRVSPSALAYRLLEFRLVDAGGCDRFKKLTALRAASLAGRDSQFAELVSVASTRRLPGLLVRDSYAAYAAGLSTLRPYANLIGADVNVLRDALETEPEAGELP